MNVRMAWVVGMGEIFEEWQHVFKDEHEFWEAVRSARDLGPRNPPSKK